MSQNGNLSNSQANISESESDESTESHSQNWYITASFLNDSQVSSSQYSTDSEMNETTDFLDSGYGTYSQTQGSQSSNGDRQSSGSQDENNHEGQF